MDILERLKARTGETDEALLQDCIESAKNIYLSRRYPFGEPPTGVEPRYLDWQYRCALALYNKDGADGQISHSENGISRAWGSESVPKELLAEIPPFVGTPR